MEASLQKIETILSKKFSTSLLIQSNKSEINYKFKIPLILDQNLNYELGLVYFSTINNIHNVTNKNNKIIVEVTDGKNKQLSKNIAITPGAYEIKEISNTIENEFKYDKSLEPLKEKEYYIKFQPNPVNMNVVMKIAKGCKIKFPNDNSLADVLCFEKNKSYEQGIYYSCNKVNISNVNRIMIECNVVEGAYLQQGDHVENSNIIYDFPSNTVPRGYKIIERPMFPIYYPLIIKNIDNIKFKIVYNDGKLVDFNGEEIIITIHMKQV